METIAISVGVGGVALGAIEVSHFVPYREVVLSLEVKIY